MSAMPRRDRPPFLSPNGWKAGILDRARLVGALVAVATGLPAIVALSAALAAPTEAALPLTVIALCVVVLAAAALGLRLARAQADADELARHVEALQDRTWELHEADHRPPVVPPSGILPVAMVSHEIRAPLHGMLGLTDLLLETPLTPEQETYVRAFRTSGGALARLVDDLLDLSRIEAGRFELNPEPTALEPLMEQIAELLAPRAHAKGLGLATLVSPALVGSFVVDAGRLRQVLVNLAGNGIAFTERGAVVLSAEPAGPVSDGRMSVSFSVTDTGPGIAPQDRERIFSDFERANASRGTGLGLAISRRILDRMGARIGVSPRAGGGSVFRFALTLPVEEPGPQPGLSLIGQRILVVADEMLEAGTIASRLEGAQASCRIASTAIEAARLAGAATAAKLPYDIVLVDARAAADPALTLARIRSAAGWDLPAVILIEPADRGSIDDYRAAGFDAYLIRPIRASSLLRIVSDTIERRGAFRTDPADDKPVLPPVRAGRRPVRVLLAEDDPVTTLLLRAIFDRMGYDVVDTQSGAGAAAAAAAERFDMVLIDLHLADGQALGTIARLRAGGAASIVAMSGDASAELRAEAQAAGADLFLQKPISPDALRRAVEAACPGLAA